MASEDNSAQIGQRLEYDGYYAVIKFIGEIEASKGIWYGVEWDDAERGKHSGNHKGVQYFQCSIPNSGSFVRPKRVNLGCSFVTALKERYGTVEDTNNDSMYVTGANNQLTKVEIIGADKIGELQSQLDKLDIVGLREMMINCAGTDGEITSISPNLISVDISRNLFNSWKAVADITVQLRNLKTLNVSSNRLSLPMDPESLRSAFQNLTQLFINDLNVAWDYIDSASVMWPNLKELHVCQNNITEISNVSVRNFSRLELLNLEKNQISEWNDILKLSALPRLKSLILNENRIRKIDMKRDENDEEFFSNLTSLSLYRNLIDEWDPVNSLNELPGLTELRFKFNPVIEQISDPRQSLIARLKSIKAVNGSSISSKERMDAEMTYMKDHAPEFYQSGGHQEVEEINCTAEFLMRHPRFLELVKEYGPPTDPKFMIINKSLKDRLIRVNIVCPGRSEIKPVVKKLPGSITVLKLKSLFRRLFNADITTMKLTYCDRPDCPEIRMSDNLREMSFYSIENDNTIYVRWK
ncbi:Tubulin-specific chaperone E [Trichoplax sp. H2]|nr:Tubulin-specific chaperone E [Trichoplax sp. H2]|eukprot:RDD37809.1 Tubulin-specific chaperone E [Trichoplax sp. H2]